MTEKNQKIFSHFMRKAENVCNKFDAAPMMMIFMNPDESIGIMMPPSRNEQDALMVFQYLIEEIEDGNCRCRIQKFPEKSDSSMN